MFVIVLKVFNPWFRFFLYLKSTFHGTCSRQMSFFEKLYCILFWSRLSYELNLKQDSWKIKVLSMQYRFEKLYDYSCKLLPFSRETLRKEPSQFREKQQNSSAVKAFSHYKIMSFFINETKNITTVPSKCHCCRSDSACSRVGWRG